MADQRDAWGDVEDSDNADYYATILQYLDGKALVGEADLWALVECAARHCPDCWYSNEFNYGEQATCDGDLTRGQCIAALQDCLGLSQPEVPTCPTP